MTTARPSFYVEIHKGIRSLLFDLVRKSGQLDFADAPSVALFREELKAGIDFLMRHAEHENQFVGPLLARHTPELYRRIVGIHDAQEKELPELLAMIDRGAGHNFVLELARIAGELLVHMTEEEEVLMPALWAVMTDEEINAAHDALVASIPPDEMAYALRWMLPAMNGPERAALEARMAA